MLNSDRDRDALAAEQATGRSARSVFVEVGKPWRQAVQIAGFVGGLALVGAVAAVNAAGGSVPQGIAIGLLFFPLIIVLLPVLLVSRLDRAVTAFVLPGAAQVRSEWQRLCPDQRFPATPAERRAWLEAHPLDASDATLVLYRTVFLCSLGEYDEARGVAEAMATETPMARFQQADALAGIAFERDGSGDLTKAQRLVREIHDPADRSRAEYALATSEATRLLAAGDDWRKPYATAEGHPRDLGASNIATLSLARLTGSRRLILICWSIGAAIIAVSLVG